MTRPGRPLASCIALTVGLVAAPVRAGAPEVVDAEDRIATAEAAFEVGLQRWRRGNYGGAVTAWTSAHRLLGSVDDLGMQRILGFDLAQAHLRVWVVDHDRTHLWAAQRLLEDYVYWIDRPGHRRTAHEDADRDHALEMLAFVEIEQAALASTIARSTAAVRPPPPPPPPPTVRRRETIAMGLVIGGSATLGVGIVFAGALGGLARSARGEPIYLAEHESPRKAIIATAVCMSLFSAAGIGMLAAGLVKRRALITAYPTLARGHAGVAVGVSF